MKVMIEELDFTVSNSQSLFSSENSVSKRVTTDIFEKEKNDE